jgi:hypothetical protein
MLKTVFFGLLMVFIIIQLFQPDRNTSSENFVTDVANHYQVPDSIETLLAKNCYDCHSNNTDYPWFINVQPVGWYMQSKVERGKTHLNFSEFALLSKEAAIKKLTEIEDVMNTNRMPLKAYKWYNESANLSQQQRTAIINWASQLKQQLGSDSTTALNPNRIVAAQ